MIAAEDEGWRRKRKGEREGKEDKPKEWKGKRKRV